jgi:ribonuclease HI
MPGVPRNVAEHSLNVLQGAKPVKQTLRRFAEDRRRAIGEEITRLLAAGFIKEVLHPDWLANPVLVLKKNKTWRMCVDYTSLNKACPKDPFALPRIDQVVDSTAGCELLCFLDAYSGYHQIKMKESDQIKTSFITPYGAFCYISMPFGLKNAGATYQRCIQNCLHDQIGRNVQAYVDDIVVKTKKKGDLLADLAETFANLRRFNIKLNPNKCVFGVPSGKLLGFIVSERGIEANPDKIDAILKMGKPKNLKAVQRLTGCVAALSRFISRLGEKALPLYRLLKKSDSFEWTVEAQHALDDLKRLLSTSPVLVAPLEREPMLLYISATNQVVSVVLVVERDEEGRAQKVQRPVYYVSEVLTDSKQRYPHYQKLVYGVFMAARKLVHYFQAHSVTVVSHAPLSDIIGNRDATGRVAKWAIELMAHDINYEPRKAIKSQALADFIVEWTEAQSLPPQVNPEHWIMYFDGSKMLAGAGAGVVFISPKGDKLNYVLQLHFTASNNVAEYEALLHGLRIAVSLGIRRLLCRGDSDLVVQQVMKSWDTKDPNMAAYCAAVRRLEGHFEGLELHHIRRCDNEAADSLARIGSTRDKVPPGFFLQQLHQPSVKPQSATESPEPESESPNMAESAQEGVLVVLPLWTQPLLAYLLRKELPEDQTDARRIVRRAQAYTIINGELYKRSTTGVFQRCISAEEGRVILQDIHSGVCGHHASSRALVAKAFRHGFFWPTALADSEELVRACIGCQKYARQPHMPATALKTIPITWPFAVWGLDMVGPLKTAKGGFTHLLVAVDKFTKWIEAKPIMKLDGPTAVNFIKGVIF